MDKKIENQNSNIESTQKYVEGSLNALDETLESQSERVSEVVGEKTKEEGSGTSSSKKGQDTKKSISGLDSISSKISKLLFGHGAPKTIPKSRKQQEKYIHKELLREQKRLLKKVHEITSNRRFSASNLEKTLIQLRQVQKLMSNLVYMAVEQIKELYQKYVLKGQ